MISAILGPLARAHASRILKAALANVRSELGQIENKIEAVIGQGAREGKTISTEKVLSRVEELKSSYTGPDREAFVEEIDRVMTEVREKYGPEIPVDEAYRLQKELERKQAD
jgi:hypothetical protein